MTDISNVGAYRCEIIALEPPKVRFNCRRCNRITEFYCSEKFRMNAQQKTLDVWLIYRCVHCDSTWNHEILSRVHTDSLDKEMRRRYQENDRETAWHHAFQIDRLRRVSGGVNTDIPYRLELNHALPDSGPFLLTLSCRHPFELRLDKALAELLGISRSRLEQWAKSGGIQFADSRLTLKSKLKGDVRIAVNP